jgi:hypothetical protein
MRMERSERRAGERDDRPTPQPEDTKPSGDTDAGSGRPSPLGGAPDPEVPPIEERGAETDE